MGGCLMQANDKAEISNWRILLYFRVAFNENVSLHIAFTSLLI